jgi:hypothetical protein
MKSIYMDGMQSHNYDVVETHGRASLQLIFHGHAFLGDDQSVKWHADGWAISPNGDKNIRLFAI